ncbi:MAG: hypothetical protein ACRDOL_38735 [Streptosporangiaceae bacterium]
MLIAERGRGGNDRPAEPAIDLGPEPHQRPQVEGQVIVGDPVDAPPGARALFGDREQPFDDPQLGQPVQGPGRLGPDGIGDLIVPAASGGDRG